MASLTEMLYAPTVHAPTVTRDGQRAAWHATSGGRPAIHVGTPGSGDRRSLRSGVLTRHQPHVFCWGLDGKSIWIATRDRLLRVTLTDEIAYAVEIGRQVRPIGDTDRGLVYGDWSRRDRNSMNLQLLDPKTGDWQQLTTHSQGHQGVAVHPAGHIAYLPRGPGRGNPTAEALPTTVLLPDGDRIEFDGRFRPVAWHGNDLLLSDDNRGDNVGSWNGTEITWIGEGQPLGFEADGTVIALRDGTPVRLPGGDVLEIIDRPIRTGAVRNGRGLFITRGNDDDPPGVIGWDGTTPVPIETPRYAFPPADFRSPEVRTYEDSAGENRDVKVLLPDTTPAPTVVHLYGHVPDAGDFDRKFGRPLRYLREQGYACLLPAHGGGWGNSDRRHADYAAVARWAAGQPWSNGELVAIGHSSGGYDVLMQAVRHPEPWTAGVAWSAIVDRRAFYEQFERDRDWIEELDEGGSDRLEEFSPCNHVDRIELPLLLIQGAHEDFQPETRAFVDRVRSQGVEIEYVEPARLGHWTTDLGIHVHVWRTIEIFLTTTLASRWDRVALPSARPE